VLAELGIKTIFHKVAQRPGKPMWFGVGPSGQTVYALPGNPVSTLTCLVRYVLPGLAATAARQPSPAPTIALATEVEVKPALTVFLPVKMADSLAHLRPTRGSGDFTSLIGTDGFVELAPGPGIIAAGTRVPFYHW
jgi:molybdopterin molybdotransferase